MSNGENFKRLVSDLIKSDAKYANELNIFVSYLENNNMLDNCFDLSPRDIDKYFDSLINIKIGSPGALNVHIAALSSLFEYLMKEKFPFRDLNGHIGRTTFRNEYLKKIDAGSKKKIIPMDILKDVLNKMDVYFAQNTGKRKSDIKYFHLLIARLYIELSLLIPLKPGDLLALKFGDIKDEKFREIVYNEIVIKLPKSIRNYIIETVDFAEQHFNVVYDKSGSLFDFLYSAVDMRANPSTITGELQKLHKAIGANEMLKTYKSETKNISLYPVESYKKTAIFEMLNNGVNIVYLKQLTGLDINTLLSDYDLGELKSNVDVKSQSINSGLVNSAYYSFL